MKNSISHGTVHKVPADLRRALANNLNSLKAWESLTPLARNEWICWVESVKKMETRDEHIERVVDDLNKGKRRPCCWYGCIHRADKAISPSIRNLVLNKRK